MLTHIESLVGGVNDNGIFQHIVFFEIIQYASHVFIQRFHRFCIIGHIALVFPQGKFFPLRIILVELINNRLVMLIPGRFLCRVQPCVFTIFICFRKTGFYTGTDHLQIIHNIHIMCAGNAHLLFGGRYTAFIIVEEIGGDLKYFVFIQRQISCIRHPITVNRLVM